MTNFNYDYEPNDISSDTFLSEVPLSLMKENIISQFDDPMEYRKKDHITTFINMYKYSEQNVDVYEDEEIDNVIELRDDFYTFMRQIFEDYLGLGFVDFDDMSKEDQDDMIHYTYRFFIMNIKKNFVSFILNYLDKNKEYYMNDDKKKDVTTLSFNKDVTDQADVYILSNLSSTVESILNEDISVDDFLENCDMDESCLETRFVIDKYNKFLITGNFVDKYVYMLDDDFRSEIEYKVRSKILKKYKKK